MPAINFLSQFADDVEAGRKRQTIRPRRKRPIKVGDTLYLYTGMRTKQCRRLRVEPCQSVKPLTIGVDLSVTVSGHFLPWNERRKLAIADGFRNFFQMVEFFSDRYGLPFEGDLTTW